LFGGAVGAGVVVAGGVVVSGADGAGVVEVVDVVVSV
jgi:hypothetical protein